MTEILKMLLTSLAKHIIDYLLAPLGTNVLKSHDWWCSGAERGLEVILLKYSHANPTFLQIAN